MKYSFANSTTFPGQLALWRQVNALNGGVAEELMGPFATGSKFRFYVAPAAGGVVSDTSYNSVAVSDTSRVRGVDVKLVGSSQKQLSGTSRYATSTQTTAVFFHNLH